MCICESDKCCPFLQDARDAQQQAADRAETTEENLEVRRQQSAELEMRLRTVQVREYKMNQCSEQYRSSPKTTPCSRKKASPKLFHSFQNVKSQLMAEHRAGNRVQRSTIVLKQYRPSLKTTNTLVMPDNTPEHVYLFHGVISQPQGSRHFFSEYEVTAPLLAQQTTTP